MKEELIDKVIYAMYELQEYCNDAEFEVIIKSKRLIESLKDI